MAEKNFFKDQGHDDPKWALERYVEDLERELAGARQRGDKEQESNVVKALAAVGHKAETRPRAAASEER